MAVMARGPASPKGDTRAARYDSLREQLERELSAGFAEPDFALEKRDARAADGRRSGPPPPPKVKPSRRVYDERPDEDADLKAERSAGKAERSASKWGMASWADDGAPQWAPLDAARATPDGGGPGAAAAADKDAPEFAARDVVCARSASPELEHAPLSATALRLEQSAEHDKAREQHRVFADAQLREAQERLKEQRQRSLEEQKRRLEREQQLKEPPPAPKRDISFLQRTAKDLEEEAERVLLEQESYRAFREAQDDKKRQELERIEREKQQYQRLREDLDAQQDRDLERQRQEAKDTEEKRKKRHKEVEEMQNRRACDFGAFLHELYSLDSEADRYDDYVRHLKEEHYERPIPPPMPPSAPPRTGGSDGRAGRYRPSTQRPPSASSAPRRPPPPQLVLDPVETALVKALEEVRHAPVDAQRRRVKELMVQWHPDKHPDSPQRATKVFQFLQTQIAERGIGQARR